MAAYQLPQKIDGNFFFFEIKGDLECFFVLEQGYRIFMIGRIWKLVKVTKVCIVTFILLLVYNVK